MTETVEAPVTLAAPEVRTFAGYELREVDGTESGSFLEGLAVPFDEWADIGWFMEQHARGSFTKTIREGGRHAPLLLWHDNRKFPIGTPDEWIEEDKGLRGIWRIDTKDDDAIAATRKAREGFLRGMSVGFAPIDSETTFDNDEVPWVRRLESRLLEVSLTPTPAFAGAQVSLVRSRVAHRGEAVTSAPGEDVGRRRSAELDGIRNWLEGVKE